MPDRRCQRSIAWPSVVRRRREHWKSFVGRRSTWIQLATRRGTERNTSRFEITLEAHCHHGGIRRGRLQERRSPRRQRGWLVLVLVLVDRCLITLRGGVTGRDTRALAGGPRQRRRPFFFACIGYRESNTKTLAFSE